VFAVSGVKEGEVARANARATIISSAITAVATCAAAVIATLFATHQLPFQGADQTTRTAGSSALSTPSSDPLASAEARIDRLPGDVTDVCATFTGTAHLSDGEVLWIGIRDSEGVLFLDQSVEVRSGTWRTQPIEVSDGTDEDRKKQRSILALAVPKALSDLFIDFRNSVGIGQTTHGIPGARELDNMPITPLGKRTRCP
jgi:hypothetical protein